MPAKSSSKSQRPASHLEVLGPSSSSTSSRPTATSLSCPAAILPRSKQKPSLSPSSTPMSRSVPYSSISRKSTRSRASATANGWTDVLHINVLVKNAGIMACPYTKTQDDLDPQFANQLCRPILFHQAHHEENGIERASHHYCLK